MSVRRWLAPLIAISALLWFALLIAAPSAPGPVAGALYGLCALICHQLTDRSFHLAEAQLPVCARCLGIYAAAALTAPWACARVRLDGDAVLRIGRLRLDARRTVALGCVPVAASVLLEWLGLWAPSNAARALTGVSAGTAVTLVVVGAAATLHYVGCAPRRPTAPPPSAST